jgi:DNA-binding transcriptional MocR family regulator
MDRPGYIGALQTFRAAGAHLVGWDVARADPGELEDLIVRYRPKLIYTNPSFQNPSGRVLPLDARRELLDLAARSRLPVIEDEPYRELYFDAPPPPSLRALDRHGVVISLGSFSKTLAPGLRLGWLVAAESIVDQLALVKARSDVFSPTLPQLVMAELLAGRAFDEHLRALRGEHRRRRDALLAALRRHLPPGALSWSTPTGGLYLWGRLQPGLDSARLLPEAAAAGVSFVAGETFYPDGGGRHQLRLCFTAAPPRDLEEGARRLGALLADPAAQRRLADATLRPLV